MDENNYEDIDRLNLQIMDNLNRFNDPVQRDVIMGDWDRKRSPRKNQRISLIVFLIFVLLMVGAIVTFVYAGKPATTSEQYEQLLDEETRLKRDNMNRQMDEIVRKQEEDDLLWKMMIGVAAVISLIPIARVITDVVRNRIHVRSAFEVIQGAAILVLGSLLLFGINLFFLYMSFKVEQQVKLAILSLITLICVIALLIWYFRRGIHYK